MRPLHSLLSKFAMFRDAAANKIRNVCFQQWISMSFYVQSRRFYHWNTSHGRTHVRSAWIGASNLWCIRRQPNTRNEKTTIHIRGISRWCEKSMAFKSYSKFEIILYNVFSAMFLQAKWVSQALMDFNCSLVDSSEFLDCRARSNGAGTSNRTENCKSICIIAIKSEINIEINSRLLQSWLVFASSAQSIWPNTEYNRFKAFCLCWFRRTHSPPCTRYWHYSRKVFHYSYAKEGLDYTIRRSIISLILSHWWVVKKTQKRNWK